MLFNFLKLPFSRSSKSLCEFIKPKHLPEYIFDRRKPANEILDHLEQQEKDRLEEIKQQINVLREEGQRVPTEIPPKDLLTLLCMPSYNKRVRFLDLLASHESQKLRKKMNKQPRERLRAFEEECILRVLDERGCRRHFESYQAVEMRLPDSCQPLIYDFSYQALMRLNDQKNLAYQLAQVHAHNKMLRPFPFHMMFCNLQRESNQWAFIEHDMGCKDGIWDRFITISEKPYPLLRHEHPALAEREIVYLSPDARHSFKQGEWDDSWALVVGALVDKVSVNPVSVRKAHKQNVILRSLPIDDAVDWRSGNKRLPLTTVHRMLAHAKASKGDWKTAIRDNVRKSSLQDRDAAFVSIKRQFALI